MCLKPTEGTKVMGITNKVGHRYVPFLDYDGIKNVQVLYAEIRSLQEKFLLGNAYFFQTGNGYHVIFLDLLNYDTWISVLEQSMCDPDYKIVPQNNESRVWVLRISSKKNNDVTFFNCMTGFKHHPVSHPHKLLLHLRGVPTAVLPNPPIQKLDEFGNPLVPDEFDYKNTIWQEEEMNKDVAFARYTA